MVHCALQYFSTFWSVICSLVYSKYLVPSTLRLETSSSSKISVFKMFTVHTLTKSWVFNFLQFEERFRKARFSWQISVDGRPNRGNKAGFSKFYGEVWTGLGVTIFGGTYTSRNANFARYLSKLKLRMYTWRSVLHGRKNVINQFSVKEKKLENR